VTFDEAVAWALSLPGTELSTSYGKPAVKVAANGRAFLFPSHEAVTSFGVAIDVDTIEILKATDPDTIWHGKDEARVRELIGRSFAWVAAKPKARPRQRK
jgi:hypothetical protein